MIFKIGNCVFILHIIISYYFFNYFFKIEIILSLDYYIFVFELIFLNDWNGFKLLSIDCFDIDEEKNAYIYGLYEPYTIGYIIFYCIITMTYIKRINKFTIYKYHYII